MARSKHGSWFLHAVACFLCSTHVHYTTYCVLVNCQLQNVLPSNPPAPAAATAECIYSTKSRVSSQILSRTAPLFSLQLLGHVPYVVRNGGVVGVFGVPWLLLLNSRPVPTLTATGRGTCDELGSFFSEREICHFEVVV